MWYVVQTVAGREFAVCRLIESLVEDDVLQECFVPRYEVQKQFRGQWRTCTATLFPGYLIVVTDRVDLEGQLSRNFISGGAFGSAIASLKDGEKSRAMTGRDLARRIGSGTGSCPRHACQSERQTPVARTATTAPSGGQTGSGRSTMAGVAP
mgnify:CR=1 FL=1